MGLRCKIGLHKFKATGIIEKVAVFDIYRPYSLMEKHVCECCNKEEWREVESRYILSNERNNKKQLSFEDEKSIITCDTDCYYNLGFLDGSSVGCTLKQVYIKDGACKYYKKHDGKGLNNE